MFKQSEFLSEKYSNRSQGSNEDLYFEVERIVEKKLGLNGKIYYLVKWAGYGEDEMTWEPIENLTTVKDLVENFEIQEEIFRRGQNNFEEEDFNTNLEDFMLESSTKPNESKSDLMESFKQQNNLNKDNKQLGLGSKQSSSNNKQKVNLKPPARRSDRSHKNVANKLNSNKYINKDSLSVVKTRRMAQKNFSDIDFEGYAKGSVEYDVPSNIYLAKLIEGSLYYWVTWEPRSDGIAPEDSLVSHQIMKHNYPLKLIDFFEKRLKYGENHIPNPLTNNLNLIEKKNILINNPDEQYYYKNKDDKALEGDNTNSNTEDHLMRID